MVIFMEYQQAVDQPCWVKKLVKNLLIFTNQTAQLNSSFNVQKAKAIKVGLISKLLNLLSAINHRKKQVAIKIKIGENIVNPIKISALMVGLTQTNENDDVLLKPRLCLY